MLRRLPVPSQDENNSADEANASNNGADWNGVLFVFVDLERTEFRHVFLGRETRVAAISKRDDPDNNQDDP
jgi:hypothetical protein